MRKEKSRDAARSRRGKENHEFYELAKLLPLPAAITSQLDFLDKASIIRLTISFLKLRQFSVNGHPPWSTSFTTLASVNPYTELSNASGLLNRSSSSASSSASLLNSGGTIGNRNLLSASTLGGGTNAVDSATITTASYHHQNSLHSTLNPLIADPAINTILSPKLYAKTAADLFELHQGTHMLHSLDGFAFAIGRDGRFLYISETVSMYLGLSQVEMTGSSVFDYTHHQDHQELANQLGIPFPPNRLGMAPRTFSPMPPSSVQSPCLSLVSNETTIEDHVNVQRNQKRTKMSSSSVKTSQQAKHKSVNKRGSTKTQIGQNRSKKHQQTKKDHNDDGSVVSESAYYDETLLGQKATSSKALQPACESTSANCQPAQGTAADPLVRQFCIRMKSTLTKRGCQHFKSSGYRVVHVVSHLRTYQSNDHGHLMDPYDEVDESSDIECQTTAITKQQQKSNTRLGKSGNNTKKKGSAETNNDTSSNNNDTDDNNNDKGNKNDVYDNNDQPCHARGIRRNKDSKQATFSGDNTNQNEPKKVLIDKNNKKSGSSLKEDSKPPKIIGMVAVAIALPPPSINELRLEADTFVLRLSLDLKITHAETRVFEVLHHPIDQLTGRSLYSLVHPGDLSQVKKCHQDLMQKGQMMSGYYRLLGKSGGFIWVQTCATLICNNTMGGVLGPPLTANSPMASSGAPLDAGGSALESLSSSFSSHNNPKMSPSTASHFSSNYDLQQQQEQDQCIIFVNYMISNLTNESDILDICQSEDYLPLHKTFNMTTNCSNISSTSSNCQQLTVPISPSSSSSPNVHASIYSSLTNHQQRPTALMNSPSYTATTSTISAASTPSTTSGGGVSRHNMRDRQISTSDTQNSSRTTATSKRKQTGGQNHSKKDKANSRSLEQQSQDHLNQNITTLDTMSGGLKHNSINSHEDISYNDSSIRLTNLDDSSIYTQEQIRSASNNNSSSIFTTPPSYGSPSQSCTNNYSNHHLNHQQQQNSNLNANTTNHNSSSGLCDSNNTNSNHLIASAIHLYNNSCNDTSNNEGMHHHLQQHDQSNLDETGLYNNGLTYKRRKYSDISPLRPWRESINTAISSTNAINPISTNPLSQLTSTGIAEHHNTLDSPATTDNHMSSYFMPIIHSSAADASTMSAHHHMANHNNHNTGYANNSSMTSHPVYSSTYGSTTNHHKRDQTMYQTASSPNVPSASSSSSSSVLIRHMSGVLAAQTVRQQTSENDSLGYLSADHHNQQHQQQHQIVNATSSTMTPTSHLYQTDGSGGIHSHHHHVATTNTHPYLAGHTHSTGTPGTTSTELSSNAYYNSLVDPYHHHHLYKNGSLHHQSSAAAVAAAAAAAAALAVNNQSTSMGGGVSGNNSDNSSTTNLTNLNHHHHHSSVMHHHQPHYNHSYSG